MEIDCCPVMLTVSIATSHSFYLFNLGIKLPQRGHWLSGVSGMSVCYPNGSLLCF